MPKAGVDPVRLALALSLNCLQLALPALPERLLSLVAVSNHVSVKIDHLVRTLGRLLPAVVLYAHDRLAPKGRRKND